MINNKEIIIQKFLQCFNDGATISFKDVQEYVEMKKREEIIKNHPYSIWQGKTDKKWYTYIPDETKERKKALKKRNSQKDIEDVVIEYHKSQGEKSREYTFNDVYFMWREIHDKLVDGNSVAKYDTDYNRFFQEQEFVKNNIKDITEDSIKVYMCQTIKRLELGKETTRKLFGYISNTITCARKKEIIFHNPIEFLQPKDFYRYCYEQYKPIHRQIICDDDMKSLRMQFRKDHEKHPNYIPTYAVEFASLTGMRVSEISALRWDCITKDYIIIDKSEKSNKQKNEFRIDKTKNGKIRFFPMTKEIRNLLDKIMAVQKEFGYLCEWVFANESGRIHAKTISSCSQTKCRQIGIDEKGIHAYRKTLNSKMRCNGVSSTVAASLLGHTAEVNEHYYTFDITNIDEKTKIVSQINEMTCAV